MHESRRGETVSRAFGGIDLSIQAVASMTSVILAVLLPQFGFAAIPVAVLAGCLSGAVGGAAHTRLRIPSFIATHFGRHGRFHARRRELFEALAALERRVMKAMARGDAGERAAEAYGAEVVERMAAGGAEDRIRRYFETFPASNEWHGAVLHLERRERDRDAPS